MVLGCWLLYSEIIANEKFHSTLANVISGVVPFRPLWLILVVLLLFFNWGSETQKWRILMKEMGAPSFWVAYKAILTGVFISFFTPNRMGEFAGRVLYIKEKKIEASILTVAGSLAQLICTTLLGYLAAVFYYAEEPIERLIGISVFFGLVAMDLFFYFNIVRLVPLFRWLGLPRKKLKYFLPMRHLNTATLSKVLLFSVFRYSIFTLQFYLMLKVFAIDMNFFEAIQGIGLIFLIQTLLPSVAILELSSRGLATEYAFQTTPEIDSVIKLASYSIWLINVLLPAIAGAILFLLNRKSDVDL